MLEFLVFTVLLPFIGGDAVKEDEATADTLVQPVMAEGDDDVDANRPEDGGGGGGGGTGAPEDKEAEDAKVDETSLLLILLLTTDNCSTAPSPDPLLPMIPSVGDDGELETVIFRYV